MQLKNMVSALHSSRLGGSKSFLKDGIFFGWQTIIDMWAREVERMKTNKMTRVPKLKQSYIIRDSWTRLNVAPAKIMQASKCFLKTPCIHTVQDALVYMCKYIVSMLVCGI